VVFILSRVLKNFYFFKNRASFSKYILVGISCAILELLLFYVLQKWVSLGIVWANSIAYTLLFFYNFLMQRKYAFQSKKSIKKEALGYGLLFVFNLNLSNALIVFLTTRLQWVPWFSKIIAMVFYIPTNFILYKKIIFK
jgi:putative flippase GtrA